jgi:hypothetical protein
MTPTVAEVVAEIQSLLGDEAGRVFTSALAKKGYKRAYEYLRGAMIKDQIPRVVEIVETSLGALATELVPADIGISNFGELIELSERTPGTNEDYVPLEEGDLNGNAVTGTTLGVFEWRGDTFHFYGATANRQIRIRYYDSGVAPDLDDSSVGIDGSLNFLSVYGAAKVGPSKGYDDGEIQRWKIEALGPRMDGSGGLLFDLLQPMVRASQRVQRQPQPYSVGNYSWRRARRPLYIAAPPATTGVEQVLTITGTIDGENPTFSLSQLPQDLDLYRNGILQYPNVAYTLNGTIVTFLPGYVPQVGDLLRAKATI